ncbi:MAG TPA: hypothetical protein PLC54_02400 [Spirochaetales bacterium]|nr:hypothetical protein [Spirochaetales bacterium]
MAQENHASSADYWLDILASGSDVFADTERAAKTMADRYQESSEGLWFFVDAHKETEPERPWPALLVVAQPGADSHTLAAFLAALESVSQSQLEKPMAFLLFSSAFSARPDFPADPGSTAVILIDSTLDGLLCASGQRRQAPLAFLQRVRNALTAQGIHWNEDWADGLFSALGITQGTHSLTSWLQGGYQALAMGSDIAMPPVLIAIGKKRPSNTVGNDINYLRYPVAHSVLTLSDSSAVAVSSAAVALMLLYAALHRQRREAFREAMLALLLVLLALFVSWLLMRIAYRFASAVLAKNALEMSIAWLCVLVRTLSSALMYYALSGFASRLDIVRPAARVSGMHAAALLLAASGALAGIFAPAIMPFIMVLALLSLVGSASAPAAALALCISVLAILPYLLSVFSGGRIALSSAVVLPSLASILPSALVLAPVTLWLGASLSKSRMLLRAHKPAPVLAILSVSLALAEPWICALVGAQL